MGGLLPDDRSAHHPAVNRMGQDQNNGRAMSCLPKHQCVTPGCPELVDHGSPRCPTHQRACYRQNDERRIGSAERGYDAAHRRLRVLCFIRDEWRCVDCGWEPNLVTDFRQFDLGPPPVEQVLAELRERFSQGEKHLHADHQIPIHDRPDLRLSLDNLKTRCDACHRAKTMRESVSPSGNPANAGLVSRSR